MHTPGFEFALALHRADLRRYADDHRRTAALRATALAGPRVSRFPGLRGLVTVAGGRRPATPTVASRTVTTLAEAQPCPP